MAPRRNPIPTYLGTTDGRAFCWVYTPSGKRKFVGLGQHGSPESYAEYQRVLSQIAAGRITDTAGPHDLLVKELAVRFLKHAIAYYRDSEGKPTSETNCFRAAIRVLVAICGEESAVEFGPLALKSVRQAMINAGWARTTVNSQVRRIRQVWRWGVENELIPPERWQALASVKGLGRGRSGAKESDGVKPVDEADVERTLPHLPPAVAAMVRVQLLTGCRPQDVCRVKLADIDRTREVWIYTPHAHKGTWRGKPREVWIGPKAQEVLTPWLVEDGYAFCPRREVEKKRKIQARRRPGQRYSTSTYCRAITRACVLAGVEPWAPNMLRHAAATRFREQFGVEVARVLLGHASVATSEIYAELPRQKAAEAAKKAG